MRPVCRGPRRPQRRRNTTHELLAWALFALSDVGCQTNEPKSTPPIATPVLEVLAEHVPAASVERSSPPTGPSPPAGPSRPLRVPEVLTFRTHVQHEVACSQSFETSSETSTYTLSLTPPAAAALHVEVVYASTFGPSPGRDRSGAHDFHTTHRTRVFDWAGRARWIGETLELSLDQAPRCSIPGADESTTCSAPVLPTIRCEPAQQQVAPAPGKPAGSGDVTTLVPVLHCPGIAKVTTLEIQERDAVGVLYHAGTPLELEVTYGHLAVAGRHFEQIRFVR